MNSCAFANGTLVGCQTAWIGTLATSKSSRMISTSPRSTRPRTYQSGAKPMPTPHATAALAAAVLSDRIRPLTFTDLRRPAMRNGQLSASPSIRRTTHLCCARSSGCPGRPCPGEVGRSAEHHDVKFAQPSCFQRRIAHLPDSHRDVQAFGEKVHFVIRDLQLDLQPRMAFGQVAYHRHDVGGLPAGCFEPGIRNLRECRSYPAIEGEAGLRRVRSTRRSSHPRSIATPRSNVVNDRLIDWRGGADDWRPPSGCLSPRRQGTPLCRSVDP